MLNAEKVKAFLRGQELLLALPTSPCRASDSPISQVPGGCGTAERGDVREAIHYRLLAVVSTSRSAGTQCSVLGFNSNSSATASGTAGQLPTRRAGTWADFSGVLRSSCCPGCCIQSPRRPPDKGLVGARSCVTAGRMQPLLSHPSFLHSAKSRAPLWPNSISIGRFSLFSYIPSCFVLKSVGGHLAGTAPRPLTSCHEQSNGLVGFHFSLFPCH